MHACIHTYIHTYIRMNTYTFTCIILVMKVGIVGLGVYLITFVTEEVPRD